MATKSTGTDANWNQQLQAMHAQALQGKLGTPGMLAQAGNKPASVAPANPAATSVKPALGMKAPPVLPSLNTPTDGTQVVPQIGASPSTTSQGNPAGGSGNTADVSAPTSSDNPDTSTNTAQPDYQAQLTAARNAYLKTLEPNPEIQTTQTALDKIAANQAALTANEKAGEANVMDLTEPMTVKGGYQASLQRQLAALQGQQSAQAVPLQAKLANYQAQRQYAQEQAKQAVEYAVPQTTTINAGQTVFNQATQKPVYNSPFKPVVAGAGSTVFTGDQSGTVIGNVANKPISVGMLNRVYDPASGTFVDQGSNPNLATGGLTPQSVDLAAQQYLGPTHQAPTGNWLAQLSVLNRAAEMAAQNGDTAGSMAARQAGYAASKSALTDQSGQYATVSTAFNNAQEGFDQVIKAFGNAGINTASDSPLANQKLNDIAAKLTGGNILAYRAGIQEVQNEYNRVFSRGGQVDNKVRDDVQSIINGNATLSDLANVSQELKAQGDIVMKGYRDTINSLNSQITNSGSQDQGVADTRVTPDGTQYEKGADGLYYPKASGPDGGQIETVSLGSGSAKVSSTIADKVKAADAELFKATGQHLAVNQSYRTEAEQAKLYAESQKGLIGRAAPPGKSWHEKGLAIDVTNWQAAQPYLRKYGLLNSLPDDKGHFSFGEFKA